METIKPPHQSQSMTQDAFQSFLEGYSMKYLKTITRLGGTQAPDLLEELSKPETEISESLLQAKLDDADTETEIYPVPDSGTTHYELRSERSLVLYLATICGFIINTNEGPKNEETLDVGLTDGLDEPFEAIAIETKKAPLIINISELIVSIPGAYQIKTYPFAALLLRRLKESPPVMKTQSTIDKAIADLRQTPPHISKQVLPNLLRLLIEEGTIELSDLVEGQTLPGVLAKIKNESPKIKKLKDVPGPEATPKSSQTSNQDQREAESRKATRERAETVDIDLIEDVEYTAKFYFTIRSNVLVDLLKPLFENSAILEQCSEATKTQCNSLKLDIPCVSKRSLLPALVYLVKNGSININGIDSADENLKVKIDTLLKSFNLTSKKLAEAPKTEKIAPTKQPTKTEASKDGQSVQPAQTAKQPESTTDKIETPKEVTIKKYTFGAGDILQLELIANCTQNNTTKREDNEYRHTESFGEQGEDAVQGALKRLGIPFLATMCESPLDRSGLDFIMCVKSDLKNGRDLYTGRAINEEISQSNHLDIKNSNYKGLEDESLYYLVGFDVTYSTEAMTDKIRRALVKGFRHNKSTKFAKYLNILAVPDRGPELETCLWALVDAVIDTDLETKMLEWQEEKINIQVGKMRPTASLPK